MAEVTEQIAESIDTEKGVKFRLNQTGNIFYATTSPKLQGATKDLFDSVTVLFSAMTTAMEQEGKSLFNHEAWTRLIRGSGFFVQVQQFESMLSIARNGLTINTQVVQQLLPGIVSGRSMTIAKSVLSAINGEFINNKASEKTKLSHLLFICEELFGAPSVTVRLFHIDQEMNEQLTSTPCHERSRSDFTQKQLADTFLFVSPESIAKFAGQFVASRADYDLLLNRLGAIVRGEEVEVIPPIDNDDKGGE